MKKYLKGLARVALAALVALPTFAADSRHISMNRLYDLTSTSFIYCSSLGRSNTHGTGGTARGADYTAPHKIKTSGSSTTTVSDTAAQGAFRNVNVGDIVAVVQDGIRLERVVVTNADDDTITVDTAWDLTGGYNYRWRDVVCGTGANDGTIAVGDLSEYTLHIQVATLNGTSIDMQVECRHEYGPYVIVETKNTTTGGTAVANYLTWTKAEGLYPDYQACRMGAKLNTDGGAQSLNFFFSGEGAVQ